ncbi:flippase [Halobacteriovorax sp. HLS]|uniref:flippase n=1 Tax=Halobacteriovorax sp. HLS TaxID=2234000 RepID=UPI000FD805F5|nr:flippase [Halobacteriovorax sp. HLS]
MKLKKLLSSPENKTFAFLGVEYSFKILLGTAVSVWVARYLGPRDLGNLSYVISFVLVFAPIFTMASEEVIIRSLVQNKSNHNFVMGSSFVLKVIGSFVGILLVNGLIYILNKDEVLIRTGVLIYSVSMFLKSFQVIDNYFLSTSNIKVISYSRNLIMLILSIVKVVLIFNNSQWLNFVLVSCLELLLYAVFYIFVYCKNGHNLLQWRFDKSEFRGLVKPVVPLVVISFCSVGVAKLDQIMIMNISGSIELGRYAVAVKLIELWQFVPLALISSLYPAIVSNFSTSKELYVYGVKKLYALILVFSLSLAIGTTIFSDLVIELLYGQQYDGAGGILALYVWTVVFLYLTIARNKIFIIESLLNLELVVVVLTLIFNVALNYFLIPSFGAKGAVGASILSYLFANVVVSIFSVKLRGALYLMWDSIFYIKKLLKGRDSL